MEKQNANAMKKRKQAEIQRLTQLVSTPPLLYRCLASCYRCLPLGYRG